MLDSLFLDVKKAILNLASPFLPESFLVLLSMILIITFIATVAPLIMMGLVWMEMKAIARMQNRYGPNRVGPFGLLQPVADGIKMLLKEDLVPVGADRILHVLAPITVVVPALILFAAIPFGKGMIAADLNIGLLFFIGVSGLETLGIIMAGWASYNKFSMLGAMRGAAMILSYEVPMVLSGVVVVMMAGSLSLVEIVNAQQNGWYFFTPWGFLACLIFYTCGVAEVNRTPFDLVEAESEIVAGFHTEYSGMKFSLFYMGEFLSAFAICILSSVMFLGGWSGPSFLPSWFWIFAKAVVLFFVMIWLRGTLPRLRIDQLLAFSWKFLLPLALINILVAGLWYFLPWSLWERNLLSTFLLVGSFILLSKKETKSSIPYSAS